MNRYKKHLFFHSLLYNISILISHITSHVTSYVKELIIDLWNNIQIYFNYLSEGVLESYSNA